MKNNLYHERANGNAKGSLETKAITESVPKNLICARCYLHRVSIAALTGARRDGLYR